MTSRSAVLAATVVALARLVLNGVVVIATAILSVVCFSAAFMAAATVAAIALAPVFVGLTVTSALIAPVSLARRSDWSMIADLWSVVADSRAADRIFALSGRIADRTEPALVDPVLDFVDRRLDATIDAIDVLARPQAAAR